MSDGRKGKPFTFRLEPADRELIERAAALTRVERAGGFYSSPAAPGEFVRMAAVEAARRVVAGEPLITVHSDSPGELDYALEYAGAHPDMFQIEV